MPIWNEHHLENGEETEHWAPGEELSKAGSPRTVPAGDYLLTPYAPVGAKRSDWLN